MFIVTALGCTPIKKSGNEKTKRPTMSQTELSNFVNFAEELLKWETNREVQPPVEYDLSRLKKVASQFGQWAAEHKIPGTKKGESGEVGVYPLANQARTTWLTEEMQHDIVGCTHAYLAIVQIGDRTMWYLICDTETNTILVSSYIKVEDGWERLEFKEGPRNGVQKQ